MLKKVKVGALVQRNSLVYCSAEPYAKEAWRLGKLCGGSVRRKRRSAREEGLAEDSRVAGCSAASQT